MCENFQTQRTILTFLAQSFPKRNLGLEIQNKNNNISCWNKNQHPWDIMFANFHSKWITLNFSA